MRKNITRLCLTLIIHSSLSIVLYSCGDAVDRATKTSPILITVATDFVTTDKRTRIDNIDVIANDVNLETGSALSVLSHTQASMGTVSYNGDNTFSYEPNNNISSGVDRFEYTVINDNASQASGTVEITIKPSFGREIVHSAGYNYYRSFIDSKNNYYLLYSTAEYNEEFIRKFDAGLNQWLAPVPLRGDPLFVDEKPNGDLLFAFYPYQELFISTYNPTSNSITSHESIIRANDPGSSTNNVFDWRIRPAMNDSGNLMVLIQVKLDSGTEELWSVWYDGQNAQKQTVFSQGVDPNLVLNSRLYYTNATPMMIAKYNNQLISFKYDTGQNQWSNIGPLVDGINGELQDWPNYITDHDDNVLALWSHKKNTDTAECNYCLMANWFDINNGIWTGNKRLSPSSTTAYDVYLGFKKFELDINNNITFFWEKNSDIYANSYRRAFGQWQTSQTLIRSGAGNKNSIHTYQDTFGNLTAISVTSPTAIATQYDLWATRLTSDGSWSPVQPIENQDFDVTNIYESSVTDANGNVITLFNQNDGNNTNMYFNIYNNTSNSWLGASLVEELDGEAQGGLIATNSSHTKTIAIWNHRYTDGNGNTQFKIMMNELNASNSFDPMQVSIVEDLLPESSGSYRFYVDNQGNMYLFWYIGYGSNASLWFKYYAADKSKWRESVELIPEQAGSNFTVEIVRLSDSKFQLIYARNLELEPGGRLGLYTVEFN